MTVGEHVLEFAYDASGTPMTVTLDGVTYYYLTNIQGDVVAIIDGNGALVAHYTYDAWGNPNAGSSHSAIIGHLNPLRYRGYVYDQEIGLYYLQSRYYEISALVDGVDIRKFSYDADWLQNTLSKQATRAITA